MVNGALNSTAGELKYHQTCWNRIIVRPQITNTSSPISDNLRFHHTPKVSYSPIEDEAYDSLSQSNEETSRYIAVSEVLEHLID